MTTDREDNAPDDTEGRPSKSARKREMVAMRELGETLLALPAAQFGRIPLSESTQEALALYKRLKQGEAKRRQLRYIGKLLAGEDLDAIWAALAMREQQDRLFRQNAALAQQWRDRLLQEGDAAFEDLIVDHPGLDRQRLRQLMRQSKGVKSSPASNRLFVYLRESLFPD